MLFHYRNGTNEGSRSLQGNPRSANEYCKYSVLVILHLMQLYKSICDYVHKGNVLLPLVNISKTFQFLNKMKGILIKSCFMFTALYASI